MSSKKPAIDPNKIAGQYASAAVQADRQERQLVQKYSSFNSLAKDQKIEAVKDLSLDPKMVDAGMLSPYDALANSFHRWKVMASEQGPSLDSATQGKAAANYYDRVLLPLYQKLGTSPMPRELWLQKAYTSALKYDTKYAYDPSDVKGLINGYAGGMSVLDRVAGTTLNLLGEAVHMTTTQLKGLGESFAHPSQGMIPYFNSVRDLNKESKLGTNFFEKAQEHAEELPWYGYIDKHVNQLASTDQFWHDAIPAQGFMEAAGSVIVEQAMQLPLYHGISMGVKALVGVTEGIPQVANLTQVLNATPAGRVLLPLMFAGVEGAATGAALTAPGEDHVREAWQSAIGFAVAHSVFGLAGAGLKAVMMKDILKGAEREDWDKHVQELSLGTKGQHVMSPQEERDAFKKVFSGYAAASGKQGLLAMFDEGLVHLAEQDNMTPEAVHEWQTKLLQEDRAHWNPVINVAASIRRLIGPDALVRDMTDSNKGTVRFYFNKLVDEAVAEMPVHVPQVQQMAAKAAETSSKTPAGQATIKRRATQMKNADAKSGMNKGMTDQEYLQRANKWYQNGNVQGAAKAAKENATRPVEEVKNVQSRRKDVENPGTLKVRSQYKYDSKGRITGYSMRATQDFNAYANKAAKAAGKQTMGAWLDGLSQADFAKDLEEWFYPKDLADGGFFWEHGNSENRPNFLAFMYNYKDFMPEEVQQKLEDELISTPQVQAQLNGKVDSERVLRYYALQAYNHVDDFLAALPQHKGEFNLFRSTQSNLVNPTKYQLQLHEEKMAEERKNLMFMYQKHPEMANIVLGNYDRLAAERYKLLKGSMKASKVTNEALAGAMHRQSLDYQIGDMQTETGQRENWRF